MAPETLTALGIVTPLPQSIGDAVNELKREGRLEALGRDFLEKYVATKRMEEEAFGPGKMGEEERKGLLGGFW
jgi:glutamine synthetase